MADGACSGAKRRRVLRMNILFVCTGNICRSPVGERMLQNLGDARGLQLQVSSAGTRALNGMEMHPESARILRARGIDPANFRSSMLTEDAAEQADLVLGMTREHRAFARQLAPARWKRMYALREIASVANPAMGDETTDRNETRIGPADARLDIYDPIGKSSETFDKVGDAIAQSMEGVLAWLASGEISTSKT